MAWSVGDRSFRTRREARAYARETGQKATGEYRARIERGMGQGKSRQEARGHPYWEPVNRPAPPSRGKQKYRRPDVLAGRPGRDESLPPDAARRALRVFRRANPKATSVLVAVHGIPVAAQPLGGVSPRIRHRIAPSGDEAGWLMSQPEPVAIWAGSAILPVDVLQAHLDAGESLADIFGGVPGLPLMQTVNQVELSVPA